MDILKAETYARTKAETMAKVLQETLDAKNELEKQSIAEEHTMEVIIWMMNMVNGRNKEV